jgi:hypothetical protein
LNAIPAGSLIPAPPHFLTEADISGGIAGAVSCPRRILTITTFSPGASFG